MSTAESGGVDQWLQQLGLGDYAPRFAENAIGLDVLIDLTNEDLKELGIPLGDRKRLLRAIASLGLTEPPAAGTAELAVSAGVPTASQTRTLSSEGERRQLTVLFCDLAGSTELATRLDPEDMREVIRAYQDCCSAVIGRFEGHVAKFMGDGVLAYFGYPTAHEDEAERAVRAGLALTDAVGRLKPHSDSDLCARIGIATGLVVVGDLIGEGAAQEQAVVGETPNLAARLQALAEPGSVVIAAATQHLVEGLFQLIDLGPTALKGIDGPVPAWRVLGEIPMPSRFEARHGQRLTPLVGREHELGLLLDRWSQAKEGDGQVILLAGEPGIGKSRMLQALRERLAAEPHTRQRYFCSPYHTNTALHPILDQLVRGARIERDDPPDVKLDKLEALFALSGEDGAEATAMSASLLSIPTGARYPPVVLSPQARKAKLQEILLRQVVGLAAQRPVLMLLEDAHWIDPTSLEQFDLVIERIQRLPVAIVITFRPEFQPAWTRYPHVTSLSLNRLSYRQSSTMVERITGGKALPGQVLEQIIDKADGVPLFLEELTKAVLESGLLKDAVDRYELAGPLPPLAIPATLQDSLMARLDRLAPVKEMAQIASVIGREFAHDLLVAVSPMSEAELDQALGHLMAAELVFRRGMPPNVTYAFKHALVQDAAYATLLRGKRQQLHARIAQVLEERFPETAGSQPEILARHFAAAGIAEKAIGYWEEASRRAIARSALAEAAAHLQAAVELLPQVADPDARARTEARLELSRGATLINARGMASSEVEAAYVRARDICQQSDDAVGLFTALWGLWRVNTSRASMRSAGDLAERLFAMAEHQDDATVLLEAHHANWSTSLLRGDLVRSRRHAEQGGPLYDRQAHRELGFLYGGHDAGACCRNLGSITLWLLGYADEARKWNRWALIHAEELADPQTLAHTHYWGSILPQILGDRLTVRRRAEALGRIAEEQAFANYIAEAGIYRGWALALEDEAAEAIELMRSGLVWRASTPGSAIYIQPYHRAMLAEGLATLGEQAESLACIEQALDEVGQTDETWYEAELHRRRGDLLLTTGREAEAASCFEKALDVARAQNARSWELRAAVSLARLCAEGGKRAEARDLLAPVYGWFTEGLDTSDLTEAKALLDQLA